MNRNELIPAIVPGAAAVFQRDRTVSGRSAPTPRGEDVAEAVAEQIEAEDGEIDEASQRSASQGTISAGLFWVG